jgi:stealth protein CR2/Stealth-like protein
MANPVAPSRTLRAYTTLVPPRVRAGLKARLSPRTRALLARRLTGAGMVTRLTEPLASARAMGSRGTAWRRADHDTVRAGNRTVVAATCPDASPVLARRATAQFVTDALGAAGIPFFCVRGFGDTGTVLGVPGTARAAAEWALREASRAVPGYVTDMVGGRLGRLRRADRDRSWHKVRRSTVVRLVHYRVDPSGSLVLGPEHGCDVEFWAEHDECLQAPRPNRVSDVLPRVGPVAAHREAVFCRAISPLDADQPRYLTREEFTGTLLDDITFPIDVVYTWVDGSDPEWRARRDRAKMRVPVERLNPLAANESRYLSRDELRYSLRSLHLFAPWVNHVWVVTDRQVPRWLDRTHPRVTVVDHRSVFADPTALPSFNSHAIESQLHRIPGLSEHFLYFNDDVLLGRPVVPHLFFHPSGLSKVFPSNATIDPLPPSVADAPVNAAGKNNRELLLKRFGSRVTQKMKHCPHALRRSVIEEIERIFQGELTATMHHQFRHPEDVSLTSAFYQNYGLITGAAAVGEIRYMYTDLNAPETPYRMRIALARRDYDVLCLNDTDTDPAAVAAQQRMLLEFLVAYLPVPAPWELDGG